MLDVDVSDLFGEAAEDLVHTAELTLDGGGQAKVEADRSADRA